MIVIFCDSKYRDFYSCIRIKEELEQQGYGGKVLIVNFHLWDVVTSNKSVETVLINHSAGVRNRSIIQRIKERGKKVFVLPTEGRPDSGKPLEFIVSQANHPSIDGYFSWSKVVADVYGDRAHVTGCPRFEIYDREEFLTNHEEFSSALKLDSDLPIIAVTSNFPQAKFHYRNQHFNRQDWKDLNIDKELGDPDQFAKNEFDRQQKFMSFVRTLAENYGVNFVIKPHPLEDMALWEEWRLKSSARDRIRIYRHNIHTLVSGSDLLIARQSCMTHLDAALGNIHSIGIIIDDYDSGEHLPQLPNTFDLVISPIADAFDLLEELLMLDNQAPPRDLMREYLTKYGFLSEDAAKKIATIIKDEIGEIMITPSGAAELLASIKSVDGRGPSFNDKNITLSDLRDWQMIMRL